MAAAIRSGELSEVRLERLSTGGAGGARWIGAEASQALEGDVQIELRTSLAKWS